MVQFLFSSTIAAYLITGAATFWDVGTTTTLPIKYNVKPRQSFYRWLIPDWDEAKFWFHQNTWISRQDRRHLFGMAGMSIDFLPLGSAMIMNRRVLLCSANYLDRYMDRQRDLRIWTLGRSGGYFNTPYRYRVWRVWRLLPRSNNPEHYHGPRGAHVPRHDVSVVYSWDQLYIYYTYPYGWKYPYKCFLTKANKVLDQKLVFAGNGFETMEQVRNNYIITYALAYTTDIVDCSKYLPKWWGKFICIRNVRRLAGVPNGGGLFSENDLVGIGCFEIRYNEDRILAFTDLRYYVNYIEAFVDILPGEYYEYAYPQWSVWLGPPGTYDVGSRYIPFWQIRHDLYPLGK